MQTALREAQNNNRVRAAMQRLLHNLRQYVRVYTRLEEDMDKLPDLDTAWVNGIGSDDGPEAVILDAIKMNPELWVPALPSDLCIVRRDTLARYLGPDVAEALAYHGAQAVEAQAGQLRYAAEMRERRETFR